MAVKKIKQTPSARSQDKARAFWLAGLGAVSITQKRGGALISGLIAEGHDFQVRTQKFAKQVAAQTTTQLTQAVAPFRAGLKRNVKKVGAAMQNGIADALAILGIPSKSDIEVLTQSVAALSKQLKTAK